MSEHNSSSDDEEINADRIIGRRILDGCILYILKWKGRLDLDSTVESLKYLRSSKRIIKVLKQYNRKLNKKKYLLKQNLCQQLKKWRKLEKLGSLINKKLKDGALNQLRLHQIKTEIKVEESSESRSIVVNRITNASKLRILKLLKEKQPWQIGFDVGLEPEKIIAVSDTPGYIIYAMKWKGGEYYGTVTSMECRVKCPQIIIEFYENIIEWADE